MDYLICQLSDLPADFSEPAGLPEAEQQAAIRKGKIYTKCRHVLMRELSRRTGIPANSISFTYSEHGKPEFPAQPFNISHSGDCLCLAFHHRPIGVDIERIRPRSFESLACRFMCDEQLQDFLNQGLPEDVFFICWCTAEALVKHAGDTMWHARQYPFIYRHGRIECLFPNAPEVRLFTPMPGYQGAVAFTNS